MIKYLVWKLLNNSGFNKKSIVFEQPALKIYWILDLQVFIDIVEKIVKVYKQIPDDDFSHNHLKNAQTILKAILKFYIICSCGASIYLILYWFLSQNKRIIFPLLLPGFDIRTMVGSAISVVFQILSSSLGITILCIYDSTIVFIFINMHIISLLIINQINDLEMMVRNEKHDDGKNSDWNLIGIIQSHREYNRWDKFQILLHYSLHCHWNSSISYTLYTIFSWISDMQTIFHKICSYQIGTNFIIAVLAIGTLASKASSDNAYLSCIMASLGLFQISVTCLLGFLIELSVINIWHEYSCFWLLLLFFH